MVEETNIDPDADQSSDSGEDFSPESNPAFPEPNSELKSSLFRLTILEQELAKISIFDETEKKTPPSKKIIKNNKRPIKLTKDKHKNLIHYKELSLS